MSLTCQKKMPSIPSTTSRVRMGRESGSAFLRFRSIYRPGTAHVAAGTVRGPINGGRSVHRATFDVQRCLHCHAACPQQATTEDRDCRQ